MVPLDCHDFPWYDSSQSFSRQLVCSWRTLKEQRRFSAKKRIGLELRGKRWGVLQVGELLGCPGTEVTGSKVIGSVGYFTPRTTPFISRLYPIYQPFTNFLGHPSSVCWVTALSKEFRENIRHEPTKTHVFFRIWRGFMV